MASAVLGRSILEEWCLVLGMEIFIGFYMRPRASPYDSYNGRGEGVNKGLFGSFGRDLSFSILVSDA